MAANGEIPVLWQIRFSHFNEKARWALDHKSIAHERRNLAPGLHILKAKRLTGDRTTPILVLDGEAIGDSTEIIAELERTHPDPPLYPEDPEVRRRALELEEHFDTEVGPFTRGAFFADVLPESEKYFQAAGPGHSRPIRLAQRAMYPGARRIAQRDLVDSIGGREVCRRKTAEAIERIEAELDGDYLAGDSFSVADLTAAALMAPLVAPAEFPYELPDPFPPVYEEWRSELRDRPGYRWVEETYRRHRGQSAEVGTS